MGEVAAIAVAFVFALSAILKLLDRPGTVAGFTELGVPSAEVTMWVVIALELVVAVGAIIVPRSAWLAVVLLGAFTAFLALRLVQGTTAACRCFGVASRKPLRWTSVARNAALMALSVVATTATF